MRARRVFPVYSKSRCWFKVWAKPSGGLISSTSTFSGSWAFERPILSPGTSPPTWSCHPPPEKDSAGAQAQAQARKLRVQEPLLTAPQQPLEMGERGREQVPRLHFPFRYEVKVLIKSCDQGGECVRRRPPCQRSKRDWYASWHFLRI